MRAEENGVGGTVRFQTALDKDQLEGRSHGTCGGGDPAIDSFGLVVKPLNTLGPAARYDNGRAAVGTVGDQHHWLAA